MLIQGLYNQDDFVRLMLVHEYAFSLQYVDGQEMRVAHHKGDWTFAHFKDEKLMRTFDIDDRPAMGYMYKIDPLLKGFFEARCEIHWKNLETKNNIYREIPALIIMDVVKLLVGSDNQIVQIDVIQPGRNATVNEFNGEFNSYFRPEQAKV